MKEYKPFKSGKVREVYDAGDSIIMVATDRISAFDHILKNKITQKGEGLTQMSKFWFDLTADIVPNHMISVDNKDMPEFFQQEQFRGNSMLKATLEYRFPIVKKVQGVLFTDNGYAWDKRHEDEFDMGLLKNSYGVGLRINSPLGPVKLDYGYGEDGGKFHFSFGGQF